MLSRQGRVVSSENLAHGEQQQQQRQQFPMSNASTTTETTVSNLQSALDEYKNSELSSILEKSHSEDDNSSVGGGRGRALTFGSEFDLSFPMSVEDVVSGVIGSPVAEQVTVSSCESIQTQECNMSEVSISGGKTMMRQLEACLENDDSKLMFAHTPPSLPNSFETRHFMKRQRSGSISGRLRSASELEENGWIDTQHKHILKDLIVSGDTEVLSALDQYELGDGSALQSLVKSGVLLGQKSQDIDLLGDLDLDFLTFNDFSSERGGNTNPVSVSSIQSGGKGLKYESDDGVGDLDFAFGSDHAECLPTDNPELVHMALQPQSHPTTTSSMSRSLSTGSLVVESRLRSNTFGSLCDDILNTNYDNPFTRFDTPILSYTNPEPEHVKSAQVPTPFSLTPAAQPMPKSKLNKYKIKEKKPKNINDKPRKNSKKQPQSQQSPDTPREPVPSGLGLPRSLSDPNLTTITDESGLPHTIRPDGWVGAYSPTSRKMRVDRFLLKRNHRVWTKKVKYDVRKNFADSRLRVKGRFVKKEDEMLMRELLSLT